MKIPRNAPSSKATKVKTPHVAYLLIRTSIIVNKRFFDPHWSIWESPALWVALSHSSDQHACPLHIKTSLFVTTHWAIGKLASNDRASSLPGRSLIGRFTSTSLRTPIGDVVYPPQVFCPSHAFVSLVFPRLRTSARPRFPAASRTPHTSAWTTCLSTARCRRPGPERL